MSERRVWRQSPRTRKESWPSGKGLYSPRRRTTSPEIVHLRHPRSARVHCRNRYLQSNSEHQFEKTPPKWDDIASRDRAEAIRQFQPASRNGVGHSRNWLLIALAQCSHSSPRHPDCAHPIAGRSFPRHSQETSPVLILWKVRLKYWSEPPTDRGPDVPKLARLLPLFSAR